MLVVVESSTLSVVTESSSLTVFTVGRGVLVCVAA